MQKIKKNWTRNILQHETIYPCGNASAMRWRKNMLYEYLRKIWRAREFRETNSCMSRGVSVLAHSETEMSDTAFNMSAELRP